MAHFIEIFEALNIWLVLKLNIAKSLYLALIYNVCT